MSKSPASILLEHILRTFPDPIFILDQEGTYVDIAGGTERSLYDSPDYLKTKKLHDIIPLKDADRFLVVVGEALKTNSLKTIEYQLISADLNINPMDGPATPQWYQGRVYPIQLPHETRGHVIWVAINITEKKLAELQRDKVTRELKKALSEIKTLKGILPICANCKKIRDDTGYWEQIEGYLSEHSNAQFSHDICPDCARKLYPDIDFDDEKDH